MPKGKVKWFNNSKGYGFIQTTNNNKDIFVHISAVEKSGLTTLEEGQSISYDEHTEKGRISAINLKVEE